MAVASHRSSGWWQAAILGMVLAAQAVLPARAGDSLAVALAAEPFNLDPHAGLFRGNVIAVEHVYETLVGRDRYRLVPRLATGWTEITPGRWEFTLRPEARFHDGSPVTARDVAYSLCRIAEAPGLWDLVAGVAGVEVVDRARLRVTERAGADSVLHNLSLAFVMRAPAGGGRFTPGDCGGPPSFVGSGPYRLVRPAGVAQGRVEMKAAEAWWGGSPPWRRVTLLAMGEPAEQIRMLRERQVDMIDGLSTDSLDFLKNLPDLEVSDHPTGRTMVLALSMAAQVIAPDGQRQPNPFCDARVREALHRIVNPDMMAERLFRGVHEPAWQLVQPGMQGYRDGLAPVAPDPARARDLLRGVGLPPGQRYVMAVPDRAMGGYRRVAALLQGAAAEAGLDLHVQTVPYAVLHRPVLDSAHPASIVNWGNFAGTLESVAGHIADQIPRRGTACPDATAAEPGLRAALQAAERAQTQAGDVTPPDARLAKILDGLGYHIPLVQVRDLVARRPGLEYRPATGVPVYGLVVRPTQLSRSGN